MMTPWNDPDSKSQIGAARGKTGSSFRKHRHMMDARKLLINLLYRATAQSSELPGWSHRETKKPAQCLEYILVHELTHLLEHHHNVRFTGLLNQHLPQWRTLREELNGSVLAEF
ncbi:MAG TPA: DUF45 domain-containing protein [Pseudomonas sp.]|uniref:M48 family metallopeptidase n=4 Tax=Pseudomonadota TaxID=1224 RepID=A0A9X1SRA5_9GAMM|nr:YgjP-like metallopeptidase domain-containing protein [Stutzerimonas kunmingensis]MAG66871.1 DUF45 domain-containing protein [Pseudomonadales bacterium]MAL91251.1 DUF45 domain-containing protein [Pseudomonas sp.]MBK3795708.1 DUF45 domain-containing protein [Stutzerimonas stutzeri]NKQ09866.1 M48 family metallopeptidase [Pseudomonas sp. SST3]MBD3877332.1 DUF45 domain-containing protein [Stutzerimonas kunmingensis]|tara:strand:+ start:907 stop:1248 length:342 start_codon:yes stop_codon:yes gene_type:complete